jgi:acyl carrier protein
MIRQSTAARPSPSPAARPRRGQPRHLGATTMAETSVLAVEERIRRILLARLEVDPSVVAASASDTPLLGRGIGLDSIEALALVAELEEEFAIRVEDEELRLELFESLRTLAQYVLDRLRHRVAGSDGDATG